MKVLLIETEEETIKGVTKLFHEIDQTIEVVGVTPDFQTTAEWMKKNPSPDVILINKKINSRDIKNPTAKIDATVTLSTPHIEYSFRAIRSKTLANFFQSFKELGENEITKEIAEDLSHILTSHNGHHTTHDAGKPVYKKRFLLKHGQRFIVIETADIAYFFSEGRFVFLKTRNGQKYVTQFKLEELLPLLNPSEFFRINRSWIIAFSGVQQIHPYFGHRLKLHLKPATDENIIVSRERVNDFKAWLEN